jgi:SAM-dependent methyltransferase
VDVGGGASLLVDRLLARGFTDVTLVDISAAALDEVAARLGEGQHRACIRFERADIREWLPARQYSAWHDRAVFHFIADDAGVAAYLAKVRKFVAPGGFAVFGTFAEDGPTACSGLPVRRYTAAQLGAALGPEAFEVVKMLRHVHTTPAGGPQAFSWVVARRLG